MDYKVSDKSTRNWIPDQVGNDIERGIGNDVVGRFGINKLRQVMLILMSET